MNIQTMILVVEDEDDIASLLTFSLNKAGFSVTLAKSLADAQRRVDKVLPDAVILDWMLPDGSGVDWLAQLRSQSRTQSLPVLMLTARAQEHDKVTGLERGADDYMTKPFSPKELVARINTVLRRAAPQHLAQTITFSGCELTEDRYLQGNGVRELMGNTEYKLLKFFITHPNKVYTRTQLLDWVWGDHVFIEERTVDVHILRLRKILGKFGLETHLETIRGMGYRFVAANVA